MSRRPIPTCMNCPFCIDAEVPRNYDAFGLDAGEVDTIHVCVRFPPNADHTVGYNGYTIRSASVDGLNVPCSEHPKFKEIRRE